MRVLEISLAAWANEKTPPQAAAVKNALCNRGEHRCREDPLFSVLVKICLHLIELNIHRCRPFPDRALPFFGGRGILDRLVTDRTIPAAPFE